MTTMEEIDHEYTRNIVCPHCGYEDVDSWEYDKDDGEIECSACDEEFVYARIIMVSYSTKKL